MKQVYHYHSQNVEVMLAVVLLNWLILSNYIIHDNKEGIHLEVEPIMYTDQMDLHKVVVALKHILLFLSGIVEKLYYIYVWWY